MAPSTNKGAGAKTPAGRQARKGAAGNAQTNTTTEGKTPTPRKKGAGTGGKAS